ncbi:MAG: hypothetical protein ACFFF9_07305 [Candidatus Thorarchaeota archaeon]
MILPPTYFPWQLIWIGVFILIYYHSWKTASWNERRNIALAVLLISTALLIPFHFWGTYNLNGIENDGLFVYGFGYWEDSALLQPETTYKSDTLSNLYTIGWVSLTLLTDEEVVFYLLDENFPETRYEEYNSSEMSEFFGFSLPYHYSAFNVIANWTMNVFNPSLNVTAEFTLYIEGWEDAGLSERWSRQYIQYEEPTRGLYSLWVCALIVNPIAYYFYKKEMNDSSQNGILI